MSDRKAWKTGLRIVVKCSTMVAVNDIFSVFSSRGSMETIHKIANNIAGFAVGYFLGDKAADAVEEAADILVEHFRGE